MRHPRVYTSNRMEILVRALAEVLESPLSSPFQPETILVQSKGMERYLSMELARRHGISANCLFPFPNAFVDRVFKGVLAQLPEPSPFEPEILTWRIMKELPLQLQQPGFESLRRYLEDEEDSLKRLQLSSSIADTFDQYLLFRPDMIERWERGEEDHWQAVLWRALVRGSPRNHRAALARMFLETLRGLSPEEAGLPERVSLFGISSLPRFHMDVLSALSRFMEIHLFFMNPCREYWGDILSEREMGGRLERAGAGRLGPDLLHLEQGNSLLASMGRLGRDFLERVTELGWEETSAFEDPGDITLLHSLQSDILNLREGSAGHGQKKVISGGDESIRFHTCHGPMREVEVLKDQLLHLFGRDPGLAPKDILVMTPDIESYGPYIQAVFDIPHADPTWIPFSIADRGLRHQGLIAETFLVILDLCDSRFGASRVLSILECDPVRRRFDLSEGDMAVLKRWIGETRIRWGWDRRDREAAGIPAFEENTWQAGFERLLLGYAMPGRGERLFKGILPYDAMEGSETPLLGRLLQFAHTLRRATEGLRRPRPLDRWADLLGPLVDGFFKPVGEEEREVQMLRRAIRSLGEMVEPQRAGFDQPVDLRAVRWILGRALEREGFGHGFLSGGITFCSMLPMRSIPSRVICLIGMNNDAYPRESHPLGFDLVAAHPRPGDRSRRNDDKYLFLESLLSARDAFYISFVGQGIQDNSTIPPSVLVSELMDAIDQNYAMEGKEILENLTTVHRLQPFSPRYFDGGERLFSYSAEQCEAAGRLQRERSDPLPFFTRGLRDAPEEFRTLGVEDLGRFYANPARYILNKRLLIHLREEIPFPEDKEPFHIRGLERYLLGERMMGQRASGSDPADVFVQMRASGLLPPGTVGECLYEDLRHAAERLLAKVRALTGGDAPEAVEAAVRLAGFTLKARVSNVHARGAIHYRYARVGSPDLLKGWILHLALHLAAPRGIPRITFVAGIPQERDRSPEPEVFRFGPVGQPEPLLLDLLERYWTGLVAPLPLFPRSSLSYAEDVGVKGKDPQQALRRARAIWEGSEQGRGECEDLYYRLCFGAVDPLDERFQEVSTAVFGPLLEHLERVE
ncbi:MAG: exodeoxyribonuclease V subunit gamma [Thermodesulfobacteriota bacterium]